MDKIIRGKSLTLVKLCEELGVKYVIKDGIFNKIHCIINKRNEELLFAKNENIDDFYGYLIDELIELKYDEHDKFFK
jgi:hypothetical protein